MASYAESGVDIDAGDAAVDRIKKHVESTHRAEVLSKIGSFGGLFEVPAGYSHPVLVAATDGVGTKLEIARLLGKYDTVGLDVVAMNVDDIVAQGAQPLFFLDYVSTGKVEPAKVEAIVSGVAEGCRQARCALLGGEISEHPGLMEPDEFDLVGFVVGVIERDLVITGAAARPGDRLIGLPSPGLRSNGYSLARRVFFDIEQRPLDAPAFDGADTSLGDELLRPSVIYAPAILDLIGHVDVRAIAHITGGGIPGNLPRALPADVDAVVDPGAWPIPPIFGEIARIGEVPEAEMRSVFNLGIGMVVAVAAESAKLATERLRSQGHDAVEIGELRAGTGQVHYSG